MPLTASLINQYEQLQQSTQNFVFPTEFFADWCIDLAGDSLFVLPEEWQNANLHIPNKNIGICKWSFCEDRKALSLLISDFNGALQTDQINTRSYKKLTNLGGNLLRNSNRNTLSEIDPSAEAYALIDLLSRLDPEFEIEELKIVIFSTKQKSNRLHEVATPSYQNCSQVSVDLWDIDRLKNLLNSGQTKEDLLIELPLNDYKVKALPAFSSEHNPPIKSYLVVFPGKLLAEIYSKHGERLLEQNVRTFLQFTGKVNREMRDTIKTSPDRFFAYNNGLTATTEELKFDVFGHIASFKNLQIVNGGQTTAAIYFSHKQNNTDLSEVYVQMKLSVVEREMLEEIVPAISQYANTQNRINTADFSSNHPLHREIERRSRMCPVPRAAGSLTDYFWYYERTRGQYKNGLNFLKTSSQKTAYKNNFPKSQVVVKTDIAKYYLSFAMAPAEVATGAQSAYAGTSSGAGRLGFMGRVRPLFEENEELITKEWYFENIAKAIVFKELDRCVKQADWYKGDKAQTVTYGIALFIYNMTEQNLDLELRQIWDKQAMSEQLHGGMLEAARVVQDYFYNGKDERTVGAIAMWARRDTCWERVKELDLKINFSEINECSQT